MDLWTMIVLVTAIGVGGGLMTEYLKTQRVKAKNGSAGEAPGDLEREVADLRQRVEVLEKIITDQRYQLDREITQLEQTG